MRWSQGVDCLIHECCEMAKTSWYPGCGWPSLEEKIRDLASYHTQPDDLGRVAERARAKKLAVTHLMPGSEPPRSSTRPGGTSRGRWWSAPTSSRSSPPARSAASTALTHGASSDGFGR